MSVSLGDPWANYARTVVEIAVPQLGLLVVRAALPGQVGGWPWPSPEPMHIVTAWDPGVARPGVEVNRVRQSALEGEVRPLADFVWVAVGVDPVTGHREEGVMVSGISEADALALGARYGQDAIFRWTPREWAVVACAGERRLVSGWEVTTP